MKAARLRLIIASILLFGWLGYLLFLVLFERDPVVISRSQVMASTHFVLADVRLDPATGDANPVVQVKEDLRPLGEALTGKHVRVRNIKEARQHGRPTAFRDQGPYLLALTKLDEGTYELTPPPRSPGHDSAIRPRPWVYLWDAPGVQDQFNKLVPKR
jgi:hypothetical protein